jgi:HMG (high mobility group) box
MLPEEKESWDKKAQKDKARYEVEKSLYKGPWKIPANKRTPKDPTAPKRPMSAFLAFSNKRRAALKREQPDSTNADLSKMLSKSWKEAPEDLRSKYMEEEAALRANYKVEMGKWRKKMAEEKKVERQEREAIAMEAAETKPSRAVHVAPTSAPAPAAKRRNAKTRAKDTQKVAAAPPPAPAVASYQPPQPPPPPQHDAISGNMGPNAPPGPGGMYGNPYGPGGGQPGEYGGYGAMPPGPGSNAYPPNPNMMGGHPYPPPQMGGQQPYGSHPYSKY